MEPLVDEVVTIPLADLNIIRAALNSGYYHSSVIDLAEQYRKLTQRPQSSNLTKSLHNALTLVTAYIEEARDDEPDEPAA